MELVKKNIHMNQLKCQSNIQITFDDDFNVSDMKPDIDKIIKEQGDIQIGDITLMQGQVIVKGVLSYNILYISNSDIRPIHNMAGEIPFEEKIFMESVNEEDSVKIKWEIDDLNTHLINSRKISVKGIVTLDLIAEDIYDEETAIDMQREENTYCKYDMLHTSQIAMNKKDTFRIKDEIILPSNKANIYELLYSEITLSNVDTRLLDSKINIKGELSIFLLYSGEEEEKPIQYIETEVPFSGVIECDGCNETMISDIDITILSKDLQIKPDSDGEERMIDLEVILDLEIKAYEEEELEILSDVYSTSKEMKPIIKTGYYENLMIKNNSKNRVVDRIRIKENEPKILQICNAGGNIKIDEIHVEDNKIAVDGVIETWILYITEEDQSPLNSVKGVIPFSELIEVKQLTQRSIYHIKPNLEQISVMMLDGEEIEVKASINLNTIVFEKIETPIITEINVEDINIQLLQKLPSIIGYVIKEGDSLWNIAKKYYTTVEEIKSLNHLEQEEVKVGDKLLILKQITILK